jgi:hypothetical protein
MCHEFIVHRSSFIVSLLLTCLLVLIPSCATQPWIPRHACWPDQEVSYYNVLRNDTVNGHTVFRISSCSLDARPVYEFTCVNDAWVGDMLLLHDSVAADLTGDSLNPISGFQVRTSMAHSDTVITEYRAGKVVVTSSGSSKQTLNVPNNTFDASILVMAIRSLEFSPGAKYTLISLSSFGPWTKPAEVEVLGEDTVKVPAGQFVCWKLMLEFAGYELYLWYEKDAPRRYVRFENPANNSSAVLTGYETQESQE